jgi:hypothetical protein
MAETKGKATRWVHNVKTVSTYPPQGLFSKDAQTIAKALWGRILTYKS